MVRYRVGGNSEIIVIRYSVDHAFQKLSTGRRNDDARCVCWRKQTKYAKHPEAWNRFSASRLTVVMVNRHLSFRFEHIWPIKNFEPLEHTPFAYNICNSFRFGLRSRCSPPMPIMTHPLMVVNS